MRRTIPAVVALLLVVSALTAVPFVMAQETDTQSTNTTDNESVAPGAQLSGVVAVGEAELDGEIEERAYGIRVARANSSDAKAAVVADQLNRTSERIAALEQRRQALEQARENGTMSQGEYRAQVARLHAESQSAARLANQTNETASELPAETLEANGVNVTAIRTLQDRAGNLTGPETAAIAQSIAGENVGQTPQPEEAKNSTDAGSGSDRAGDGSSRAGSGSDRAGSDDSTTTDETSAGSTADGSAGAEETTTVDDGN